MSNRVILDTARSLHLRLIMRHTRIQVLEPSTSTSKTIPRRFKRPFAERQHDRGEAGKLSGAHSRSFAEGQCERTPLMLRPVPPWESFL